jgi:type I restriction enzyme S subunit
MSDRIKTGAIEDLCNVEYGTRVVRKKDAGTIYPVYGGGGETFFLDSFNREDRVVVARFAMSEKCTRKVSGKFALNDSGLTLSTKEPSILRQDYLDYFVLGMNNQIYASARGTAQKNLDVPAFRRMKIVYPNSLEEQRKIVEKLDSAFANVDLLEENLTSLESLINECDTSTLGRILNSSFGEHGGHRTSTLGGVTEFISRGISPTYLDSGNTVVLNQRCIRDGRVDLNFSRRHDEKAKKVQEAKLLQNGDGLINSTGVGTLGRTALFDYPGTGVFTVDSHVTIVRPKSETLNSDYFSLVLRALENIFVSLSTGTSGQTELPREAIKNTTITFPDNLDDQKDLFKYYTSLHLGINEFRKMLINKRFLVETLRLSLLSSAFTKVKEDA